MFADTIQFAQSSNPTAFSAPIQETISTQQQSLELFSQYRELAMSLINPYNPQLYYIPTLNAPDSLNGYGLHEKFIHMSRRVMDVSVGQLDTPWWSADCYETNQIALSQLMGLAFEESGSLAGQRLQAIALFAQTLPLHTKFYYYEGMGGTKAITIEDEFHQVKFSMLVSHCYI